MENVDLKFDGYYKYDDYVDSFDENAGIYVIYAGVNNNKMTKLLYIGESGNLFNRHHRHEKYDNWKSKLEKGEELYFSKVLIASKLYNKDNRLDIEAALIYRNQPPCNSKSKDSYNGKSLTIKTSCKNVFLVKEFSTDNLDDDYVDATLEHIAEKN